MTSRRSSRRSFLQAGACSLLVPWSKAHGSNDAIRVGCIGTGGRCRHLMQSLVKVPGVRITALCDVWDQSLSQAAPMAEKDAFRTKDYAQVLSRKDIDAVLVASPDHWHVPLTVAACEAGKDVYVEKPLTHEESEGQAVLSAQKKSDRIVQVGMQQRSMPHLALAKERVQAGVIGKVLKVRMSWNRNANRIQKVAYNINPKSVDWKRFVGSARPQEFDEYRFRNWRWFWDFGGGLFTDLMVHWIDVAHWVLELDHPERAVSVGTHFNSEGVWETPDTVQTLLVYPNDVQMHFEGTFSNARAGSMIEFMGTDATLYADRGRFEIRPERNRKVAPEDVIVGTGNRGADFYDKPDGELLHLTNWIDCVKSRKQPTAPVEAGVSSAAAAHLSNEALRKRQEAKRRN